MQISPFDHTARLRHSSSYTPEEISQIEDDKLERFKILFDALVVLEAAEKEAAASIKDRNDIMKALDDARATKAKDYPARSFLDEWRESVAGRV
jgi:hypothetical protein